MNSLSIVGRIGKVGELRITAGGKSVINFSVAVDNGKDSEGEKRKPTWFEVALWEKQADNLAEYLNVGDRIGVTGQVRMQVDEKGEQQYHKLVVDFPRVELMGEANKAADKATTTDANSGHAAAAAEIDEDSIPF